MAVVIQTGFTGISEGLQKPRVCWDNSLIGATLSGNTGTTGNEADNMLDPREWNFWQVSGTYGQVAATLSGAVDFSCAAIAQHNLGTTGATISIAVYTGGAWVMQTTAHEPDNDDPIIFLFDTVNSDQIRFTVSGGTDSPRISSWYAGEVLELPQGVHFGASMPINQAVNRTYTNNISDAGLYLGRSVRYAKSRNSVLINNLTDDYVNDTLTPFLDSAEPYFLAESPSRRPLSADYRWSNERPKPEYVVRNLMKVTL